VRREVLGIPRTNKNLARSTADNAPRLPWQVGAANEITTIGNHRHTESMSREYNKMKTKNTLCFYEGGL
jgi:hypothetical protein